MLINALVVLAVSSAPIPDLEYEVTTISSNSSDTGVLSMVRVACRSGKCQLAVATMNCGAEDAPWQNGSDIMNIAIYSSSDQLTATMNSDGWLELTTVSLYHRNTHKFKLDIENARHPVLLDYWGEATFVDVSGTKIVTKRVAIKRDDHSNFLNKTCRIQLPVIPRSGQRVKYGTDK